MWRDLAQPSHLIIIAVLLVILFGWKKLPDAARSVGRSMRIFKSEVSEMKNDGKEGRPSPAATDTVPGDVFPSQPAGASPQPGAYAPPAQPGTYTPPAQPASQAPYAGPDAQAYPQPQPARTDSVQDPAREPQRYENPAL
jgi:sec-independent protein translocase protein TatA